MSRSRTRQMERELRKITGEKRSLSTATSKAITPKMAEELKKTWGGYSAPLLLKAPDQDCREVTTGTTAFARNIRQMQLEKDLYKCKTEKQKDEAAYAPFSFIPLLEELEKQQVDISGEVQEYLEQRNFRLRERELMTEYFLHTNEFYRNHFEIFLILGNMYLDAVSGQDEHIRQVLLSWYKKCFENEYQVIKRIKELDLSHLVTRDQVDVYTSIGIYSALAGLMEKEVSPKNQAMLRHFWRSHEQMVQKTQDTARFQKKEFRELLKDAMETEDDLKGQLNTMMFVYHPIYLAVLEGDTLAEEIGDHSIAWAQAILKDSGICPSSWEIYFLSDILDLLRQTRKCQKPNSPYALTTYLSTEEEIKKEARQKEQEKAKEAECEALRKEVEQLKKQNERLKEQVAKDEDQLLKKQKEIGDLIYQIEQLKKEEGQSKEAESLRRELTEKDREIQELTAAIDLMTEPENTCNLDEVLAGEDELFEGETKDIVTDVLQDAVRHLKHSRRRDVLLRLLSKMGENRIQKKAELIRVTLKDGSALNASKIAVLKTLGIECRPSKTHYHLSYYGQDKYLVICATTPSDRRSGINTAAEMIRRFL